MDVLSGYANRPLRFVLRYLRQRLASHVVIVAAVVAAVACSVGTQYGVKYLVDGLSAGPGSAGRVWLAFVFLMSLIAAENMFVWNVLPPCIATVAAIVLIGTVSLPMSAGLIVVAGGMVVAMFHLAAKGKPLHDEFADKAAAVDGEMVDVINNMPLVRAFCGLSLEHDRFDATVNREMTARGRSLRYLEKLRLTHAAVTVVLTIGLLAWAIVLR